MNDDDYYTQPWRPLVKGYGYRQVWCLAV